WQAHCTLAHVHDLGTRKAREHSLNQRVRAHAGLELGLPRFILRSDRRLALLGRYHDHPAPIRPLRELAREIVDQRLPSPALQPDLEATVLAAHQPHVALERKLDAEVALLRGKGDQILKARDDERRARLRLGQTRDGIARRRKGGTRRAARSLHPRCLDPRRFDPWRLEARRGGDRRMRRRRTTPTAGGCVIVERAGYFLGPP